MVGDAGAAWTIVVAAGTGSRFGSQTPKQFVEMAGRRVVDWSVLAAASVSDGVVVVVPPGNAATTGHAVVTPVAGCALLTVEGGATRSESVRRGLRAVPEDAAVVLVHDAARPVASAALFGRVIAEIRGGAVGVVPVVALVDTICDRDGQVVDRAKLNAVQTPQGFAAGALRSAHAGDAEATDDATLVRLDGHAVMTVEGERWNIKVTEPDDELVVAALLKERA